MLTVMLWTLVSAMVVALVVMMMGKRRKRKEMLPPRVGTVRETMGKMNSAETPWFLLGLAKRKAGDRIFQLATVPWRTVVIVAEGSAARQLLSSGAVDKRGPGQLSRNVDTVFSRKTADARHAPKRKLATPAFSARRVDASVRSAAFAGVLQDLFAILDRGEPFDPARLLTMTSLDILGRVSLGGVDFGTLKSARQTGGGGGAEPPQTKKSLGGTFLEALPVALREYSAKRMMNPWRKYYYAVTQDGQRADRARDDVWDVADAVLKAHASSSSSSEKNEPVLKAHASSSSSSEKNEITALLDHVTDPKNAATYASDKERLAEIITYLVAGHDTTGYSLAFALYEIAKQGPDFAAKLRQEINDDHDLVPQHETSLFNRTCKEALRLWPVAAVGPVRRVTAKDGLRVTAASGREYLLPHGATAFCPFLPIMRLAPGVHEPETFDPDRWLDPGQADGLRASYMPFSLGPRNCLGMAFALAELKRVLAAIVQRYDVTLVKDFRPDFFLTMKPVDGLLRARNVVTT